MAFSPDGSRLALVYIERQNSAVFSVDTRSGEVTGRRALDPPFRPALLAYRDDGAALALYGQPLGANPGVSSPDPPRVLLLDAGSLEAQWERTLENIVSGQWCLENCASSLEQWLSVSWTPAVVASRDGRTLFIVHADADRLTTVDLDARSVRTVDVAEPGQPQTALVRLGRLLGLAASVAQAKGNDTGAYKTAALSLDGSRLYVLGRTMAATRDARGNVQPAIASLGLRLVETQTARTIAFRDVDATAVRMAPDGRHVLLSGRVGSAPWTEALDAASLQPVKRVEGWEIVPSRRPDGRVALVAGGTTYSRFPSTRLAVFDPGSFDLARPWSIPGIASWLVAP
jgi:hypothetical protein